MLLSVVIPVYNEVECLPKLYEALCAALNPLPHPWEVVLVDDGSRDGSTRALEALVAQDPTHVRAVIFRRNYGQTAAMAAGIEHAAGDVIVLMDADLQNDPADIPALLTKLDEGYDVACGWRKQRQDRFLSRKLPSMLANRLIARVTGVALHDYGCTLKAFRREIITGFRLYGEMHRFIPPFAAQVGGKIVEVPVRHHPRTLGTSKYGIGRTLKVLMDLCTVRLLTQFTAKPMYLFGYTGMTFLGLAAIPLVIMLARLAMMGYDTVTLPLLTSALVLGGLGVQCLFMGLLAEMLMRTYFESGDKRPYLIRRVLNGKDIADGAAVSTSADRPAAAGAR